MPSMSWINKYEALSVILITLVQNIYKVPLNESDVCVFAF